MPIVRISQALVYFAHIPKCGGSSVEAYLQARFGPLAFLDRRFLSVPADERWSRSSPQHTPATALARLFPDGFFDHRFAMVRHPAKRLISMFQFQQEVEKVIPPTMSFSDWLGSLPALLETDIWVYDRHIRPMHETVPDSARIFRLEDGGAPLIAWLDEVAGDTQGPRMLPHEKDRKERLVRRGWPDTTVSLTAQDRRLIGQLYDKDFTLFGYDPEILV